MRIDRPFAMLFLALPAVFPLCTRPAAAGSFKYKTLSIPGGNDGNATAINDKDQVVGTFDSSGKQEHGFVWDKGVLTQVDGTDGDTTNLAAINARGIAAGDYYSLAVGARVAFTYDIATGEQQLLKVNPKYVYFSEGIDLKGAVVGTAQGLPDTNFSFVGKANGKHVQLLKAPGGVNGTFARGINDTGVVVGYYSDSADVSHGFIYQSGTYTSFDPPGSAGTYVNFINDDGSIGGEYYDRSGNVHGFTMGGGVTTVINYPGATDTGVVGISSNGEVVGSWADGTSYFHGFVELGGTYYRIDAPGATETGIEGVNAKGSLVGYYMAPHRRGFIATCAADQIPCTQ
jgi:probable HAF family extracellular repeat protein